MLVVMLGLVLFVLRRVDGVWQPTIWVSTTLENWSVSAVKSEHFSTIGE